jgi:hypothetical protein
MPQRGKRKLAGGSRYAATPGEVGFNMDLIGNDIKALSIVGGNPLIYVLNA